jgi:hypothetical protein
MNKSFTRRSFGALTLGSAATLAGASALAQGKALTLGTASTGGTYFVYGGVVASLLTKQLGVTVSTQQTQGPNQNIILVSDKKVELGMTTMGIAYQAWNGSGEWTKGKKFQDIRALFPMYDTPFHFIAMKASGVDSVAKSKGKRIGLGPRAGTPGTYFPLMYKAMGYDATFRFGQASDMANQLSDGLLDVFAFAAGLPIAAYSELESQKDVVFFTFTADEIAKIKKALPELSDSVIPKSTYKKMPADHKTLGVYNFFIAHKELDNDTAYKVTKAVLENNADLVKGHEAGKETVIANWAKNTFLPFHPGAAKYYAEKGVKLPANLIGK